MRSFLSLKLTFWPTFWALRDGADLAVTMVCLELTMVVVGPDMGSKVDRRRFNRVLTFLPFLLESHALAFKG